MPKQKHDIADKGQLNCFFEVIFNKILYFLLSGDMKTIPRMTSKIGNIFTPFLDN